MKKLSISLEYCHGIKKFYDDNKINFSDDHNVISIYAPNGIMKTSFANTFVDIIENNKSTDQLLEEKYHNKYIRSIKDEDGKDIPPENIYVIRSLPDYISKYKSDHVPSLLAIEQKYRIEHEQLVEEINKSKEKFIAKLRTSSKLRNVENKIEQDFGNDFFEVLHECNQLVINDNVSNYSNVVYNKILNEKVINFLKTPDFKNHVSTYVNRYNVMLNQSKYLKNDFDDYDVKEINKKLKKHNYFKVGHHLLLNNDDKNLSIKTDSELQDYVESELKIIMQDPVLDRIFQSINDALSQQKELADFREYLYTDKQIIPQLVDHEQFAKDIWLSYFVLHKDLFIDLITKHKNNINRITELGKIAMDQETQWKKIVGEFNSRFSNFPYEITIKNQSNISLHVDKTPIFKFIHNGKLLDDEKVRKILSSGEQRILYILQILFDLEIRKEEPETLLIMDDVVDSFDYQNKYAIIQYIQELCKLPCFKTIILTHNFDFFRTISKRRIVERKNCFIAYKHNSIVKLKDAESIWDPLTHWLKKFEKTENVIASIPFARNLIGYTKSDHTNDKNYLVLTSLLHYRDDTESITFKKLINVFKCTFNDRIDDQKILKNNNNEDVVVDAIFSQCDKCVKKQDDIDLVNKITLSIGIRLQAEKYMRVKIKSCDKSSLEYEKTFGLLQRYKKYYSSEKNVIQKIDQVVLMVSENIHINSFMYEPILDMSSEHLIKLYCDVKDYNRLNI